VADQDGFNSNRTQFDGEQGVHRLLVNLKVMSRKQQTMQTLQRHCIHHELIDAQSENCKHFSLAAVFLRRIDTKNSP